MGHETSTPGARGPTAPPEGSTPDVVARRQDPGGPEDPEGEGHQRGSLRLARCEVCGAPDPGIRCRYCRTRPVSSDPTIQVKSVCGDLMAVYSGGLCAPVMPRYDPEMLTEIVR